MRAVHRGSDLAISVAAEMSRCETPVTTASLTGTTNLATRGSRNESGPIVLVPEFVTRTIVASRPPIRKRPPTSGCATVYLIDGWSLSLHDTQRPATADAIPSQLAASHSPLMRAAPQGRFSQGDPTPTRHRRRALERSTQSLPRQRRVLTLRRPTVAEHAVAASEFGTPGGSSGREPLASVVHPFDPGVRRDAELVVVRLRPSRTFFAGCQRLYGSVVVDWTLAIGDSIGSASNGGGPSAHGSSTCHSDPSPLRHRVGRRSLDRGAEAAVHGPFVSGRLLIALCPTHAGRRS